MRPLHAEGIRELVADEGSKEIVDIDTHGLVFSGNIAKVQNFIQLINEENGPMGKEIFSFGLSLLVRSFVCILGDSNITKDILFFIRGKVGLFEPELAIALPWASCYTVI